MAGKKIPFTYFTLKTMILQNYRRQSPGMQFGPLFHRMTLEHYFMFMLASGALHNLFRNSILAHHLSGRLFTGSPCGNISFLCCRWQLIKISFDLTYFQSLLSCVYRKTSLEANHLKYQNHLLKPSVEHQYFRFFGKWCNYLICWFITHYEARGSGSLETDSPF